LCECTTSCCAWLLLLRLRCWRPAPAAAFAAALLRQYSIALLPLLLLSAGLCRGALLLLLLLWCLI
jgi:hypothetical protein